MTKFTDATFEVTGTDSILKLGFNFPVFAVMMIEYVHFSLVELDVPPVCLQGCSPVHSQRANTPAAEPKKQLKFLSYNNTHTATGTGLIDSQAPCDNR